MFGQPPQHTVAGALTAQLGWIREGAGARFDELELNVVAYPARVLADAGARADRAAEVASALGMEADQVLLSPHVWLGTVEQLCDQLEEHRDRWGISYWAVPLQAMEACAPVVQRLAGR
jgi:hypothetical protein